MQQLGRRKSQCPRAMLRRERSQIYAGVARGSVEAHRDLRAGNVAVNGDVLRR